MRIVIQRVKRASVSVEEKVVGSIQKGFLVLIGVGQGDDEATADKYMKKLLGLRIFEDENGKMNLSVKETNGKILAVSQFTLLGDVRKGKRPSFTKAARPEEAQSLYRRVIENIISQGIDVEEGIFQEEMLVEIYNDGPVTILLDSNKKF